MFYRFYRRTTVEIIKYESDLLKRWFAAVKANELNNEGEIDLVLEIMYHFDSKSNKRLLKKFEKLDYAKTFFLPRTIPEKTFKILEKSSLKISRKVQMFRSGFPALL